jgi:hypothetical protein
MTYPNFAHSAVNTGETMSGKTKFVLDLLENEYRHFVTYTVIICPNWSSNKAYLSRKWIFNDPDRVFMVDPEEWCPSKDDRFNVTIEVFHKNIGKMDEGQVLFLIDDSIAEEGIDKRRSPLVKLACSGRHDNCSLWVLTQAYTGVPKTVRRQIKWLVTFYCKDEDDFDTIMKENKVVPKEERARLNALLEQHQYSKLVLFLSPPRGYTFVHA